MGTRPRTRPARPRFSDLQTAPLRGAPGFFRVGRTADGIWWLVTPEDEPVFLRAVAGVNRHGRAGPPPIEPGPYARMTADLYGPGGADWAKAAAARLRAWGVDTVGPWADPGMATRGFYFTATADLARAEVPTLIGPGLRLPDVFDPRWPAAAEARAAIATATWAAHPRLVGWFTDDGLAWGGKITLLQACLAAEPGFAAHHAAWEFVAAVHGGTAEAAARSWGSATAAQREHVRQWTREGRAIGGEAFAADAQRFAREAARRYFPIAAAALRAADPSRLILGCRFDRPPPEGVREACAWPDVDVVSWRLRAHAPYARQATAIAAHEPQWVTGGGLGNADFSRLPTHPGGGPTRLERLLRATREGLVAACRDPRTVGLEWAHWADDVGEAPPFGRGLVHADDREAVEHTELLRDLHARAATLHARGPRPGKKLPT